MVTVGVTADVLLRGQLRYLQSSGFAVTVVASPGPELERVAAREGVDVVPVPMQREIAGTADVRSLQALIATIRSLQPDIVNASTMKAGLLGTIAARAAGVPVRIYQLRGLRLETEHGMKRAVLAATEVVAATCATDIICNSESLLAQYANRFAPARKCRVLGAGSSNGVDTERFDRSRWSAKARSIRDELGIPRDSLVIGFIGRPVVDKGVAELLDAIEIVRERHPNVHLVIVGAGFAGDRIDPEITPRLRASHVHLVDRVDEPAPYYALFDILAFPSHREGFPNVPLEAAAAGLPTVGARATGTRDVIVDGVTGALVGIRDARALAAALSAYAASTDLRRTHGTAARERAVREYGQAIVWQRWRDEYVRLLRARGLPAPS